MSFPVLVPPLGGEVVGDSSDRRVEILSDHDTVHATWSRFGPGRLGADLHVHHHHTDVFFVLQGELTIRLGLEDRRVNVPSGTLVRVPPLVVHGFLNGSDAETTYLNFHAPGSGFADFMRALRDGRDLPYDQHLPPADGGRAPSEASIGSRELVTDRGGLRIDVLADAQVIAIAEMRLDPDHPRSPEHLHHRHAESFYVLEGEMAFEVAGEAVAAGRGSWVQVPPGVPHSYAVEGTDPARVLNVHTPGCGLGRFLRAIHAARNEDEAAAARRVFDETLVRA